MSLLAEVQFGREILGNLELAEDREWLVTNGLGGFASGTAAGTSTRRYHGLLMASLLGLLPASPFVLSWLSRRFGNQSRR